MTKKKILIATGGTGGHIFPAIAIAKAIEKRINNVDFLKSSDNADSLKKDYDKKILEATKKVDLLKSQLNLIKIK